MIRSEVPNPSGDDRNLCRKVDRGSDGGRRADVTVRLCSPSLGVQFVDDTDIRTLECLAQENGVVMSFVFPLAW